MPEKAGSMNDCYHPAEVHTAAAMKTAKTRRKTRRTPFPVTLF
jgi:hypothetical protein